MGGKGVTMATTELSEPEVVVESDYDGYFAGIVQHLLEIHRGPFVHRKIVVTAGPYRDSAITYHSDGEVIHLDFYSALRAGFGHLSGEDIRALSQKL